jgi:peptidoglycan/LPS O-acetylase OafA/YrhL
MRLNDIPSLTGLRALAAWWVVAYHFRTALATPTLDWLVPPLAAGFVAVDVFFVLSGFVLALKYFDDFSGLLSRHSPVAACVHGWLIFLGKRLARIYPLHFVMLCVYLINPLAIHFFSTQRDWASGYDPVYFLLSLLLIQNWGSGHALQWNIPAWSISTEWLAYILFPLLIAAVAWVQRRGATALLLLVALACGLLSLAYGWLGVTTLAVGIESLGAWRCVCGFLVGVVLARLRALYPVQVIAWSGLGLACIALVAVACLATGIRDHVYVPVLAAALVLWVSGSPAAVGWLLASRWMVTLGTVSYSTYLAHYFIKDWVKFLSFAPGPTQFVVYLALVALASFLLHRAVELPGRRWMESLVQRRRLSFDR